MANTGVEMLAAFPSGIHHLMRGDLPGPQRARPFHLNRVAIAPDCFYAMPRQKLDVGLAVKSAPDQLRELFWINRKLRREKTALQVVHPEVLPQSVGCQSPVKWPMLPAQVIQIRIFGELVSVKTFHLREVFAKLVGRKERIRGDEVPKRRRNAKATRGITDPAVQKSSEPESSAELEVRRRHARIVRVNQSEVDFPFIPQACAV